MFGNEVETTSSVILKIKIEEYEMLKNEISKLKQDAEKIQSGQK